MDWTKLEQAIRKAIEDRQARDPGQRARVYAAARAAIGRRQELDADVLARFDALAARIEASLTPEERGSTGAGGRFAQIWRAARGWLLFTVGAVVGVGATLVIEAATMNSIGADKMGAFRKSYEASLPQVPVAVDFLHQVADSVLKAQSGDRKKLEATTKSFVPLARFDPELAKRMPASLPTGSYVILRADAFNFKVLFNWPLCGTVSVSNPAMVDRVRALPHAIGCPYFGLWTAAASNW